MSKPPRHHIVSQFHYREFTCTPEKDKNEQRVYALDHNGFVERRKIQSICHKIEYNTREQEVWFRELERIAADSIRKIINKNYLTYIDLENVRGYIAYLIANQPRLRKAIVDKMVEAVNALSIKNDIYGKGHFTLILTNMIAEEFKTWQSYIYRIQEVNKHEYKGLFITSDNPVCTNNIDAIWVNQSSMYGDTENARTEDGKTIVKYYWDPTSVSIVENTYYFLPLNPVTAIYVYKTPSQRDDLLETEYLVQKMNVNQIIGSTEYAISHDCKWLKMMYDTFLHNRK